MTKQLNQTLKIQFLAILILLVIFIFKFNRLPPQIPLLYSKPEGDEQLVDSFMIFLLPFFSTCIIIINTFIYNQYFTNNIFLETVLYYVNLLVSLFTALFFLRILFLVT